jgi:hypothetical protein
MQTSRRKFVITSLSAGAMLASTMRSHAEGTEVSETDANAKAVGYKARATQVDTAKYPAYKAPQACANCQLYQAKAGSEQGGCPLFGAKTVSAKGWCSAYVKKA